MKDDDSWIIWGAAGLAGLLAIGCLISTAKPTSESEEKPKEGCGCGAK
jgi:hypothetical protein